MANNSCTNNYYDGIYLKCKTTNERCIMSKFCSSYDKWIFNNRLDSNNCCNNKTSKSHK